jgi:hypothetical protein
MKTIGQSKHIKWIASVHTIADLVLALLVVIILSLYLMPRVAVDMSRPSAMTLCHDLVPWPYAMTSNKVKQTTFILRLIESEVNDWVQITKIKI